MALDMDALVLAPLFDAMGEPLSYNPPDGTDLLPFVGIVDQEVLAPGDGSDATGEFTPYRTLCKTRAGAFPDPAGPAQGGVVLRGEDDYVITDIRPDGRGLLLLALARAS